MSVLIFGSGCCRTNAAHRQFPPRVRDSNILRLLYLTQNIQQVNHAHKDWYHWGGTGGWSARAGTGSKLPVAPLCETIPVPPIRKDGAIAGMVSAQMSHPPPVPDAENRWPLSTDAEIGRSAATASDIPGRAFDHPSSLCAKRGGFYGFSRPPF